MSQEVTLNTLEELVSKALEQATYGTTAPTYTLHEMHSEVYLDPAAGKAWLEGLYAMRDAARKEYKEYKDRDAVEEAWRAANPQPEQRWVYVRRLERTGSNSRYNTIYLGEELGEAIAAHWTRKPLYKGDNVGQLTGMRSLKSIAAMLGKKGMDKEVKQAQAAAEAAKQLQKRQNARYNITEALLKLGEAIDKYGPELGIDRSIFNAMPLEDVLERKD